jgi:hypothetical protein
VLDTHLPDSAAETQALTEAFEEARYSQHAVSASQAARVRAAWLRLRTALAQKARDKKKNAAKGP